MTELFEHVCTRTCIILHRCTVKNWKAHLSKFEVVPGLWCLDVMQEEDSMGTIKSLPDSLQALSFLLYHTNRCFFFFFFSFFFWNSSKGLLWVVLICPSLLLLGLLVIESLNWRKSCTSHRQETAEKQSRKYKNKSVKKRYLAKSIKILVNVHFIL